MKESVPAVKLGQGSFEKVWPPKHSDFQGVHYLTPESLNAFRRCPAVFKRMEMNAAGTAHSTDAMVGRALQTLVFKGRKQFESEFAVGGPSEKRAFAQWAKNQTKTIVAPWCADLIEETYAGARRHPFVQELLSGGNADVELCFDYNGHPSRVLIDWLSSNTSHGIVILITTPDIPSFESKANLDGLFHELAFRRTLLFLATDEKLPVHVIVADRGIPGRVGVWQVSERSLDIADRDNEIALEELTRCRELDRWPTRYEPLRVLELTS